MFAACVSSDAPVDVQMAVVREAAELAKMNSSGICSESTKAGVGASGKVAIYIGKGEFDRLNGPVTIYRM